MIQALEGARIVALPILPSTLAASGISIYLNAMLLKKPVGHHGRARRFRPARAGSRYDSTRRPGRVGGSHPAPLGRRELRARTAEAGHRYALSLGGEPELRRRILEAIVAWRGGQR